VKHSNPQVRELQVSVFHIPTDAPEEDGTFAWQQTTMVLVEVSAGNQTGLGYTYCSSAAALLINEDLKQHVIGASAFEIPSIWAKLVRQVRNVGRPGIASCAISAIDTALWDLKAKLLGLPLCQLLGMARPGVPVYGSGGFTSYSTQRLSEQLSGWVAQGIRMVKMKIGARPEHDPMRVVIARRAIGKEARLFVDANGAYSHKQALYYADLFRAQEVTWFEEPVSSDDLAGLHRIRERAPAMMEIAAGEYGYDEFYFRRMAEAGAVDVLQADATRCGGFSGFLRAAAVAGEFSLPLSAHTAPSLHLHVCCAAPGALRHIEYFHDHVRIEQMLFEGAPVPRQGELRPDLTRPGLGLELKRQDAEKFAAGELAA
jgi:L-alanine-DL-glutamate epimerase-like enolase superfamily enzyme